MQADTRRYDFSSKQSPFDCHQRPFLLYIRWRDAAQLCGYLCCWVSFANFLLIHVSLRVCLRDISKASSRISIKM